MAERLSKQDVISSVANATGLSKKDAAGAVDAVVNTVKNALAEGNSVGLIGFGTFEVKTRAARKGLNPQTQKPIDIPEKNVPSFKAGKELKDAVS